MAAILSHLKNTGLSKGKVSIAYCINEAAAQKLKEMILSRMAQGYVQIHRFSDYAEKGGLLAGFERCDPLSGTQKIR